MASAASASFICGEQAPEMNASSNASVGKLRKHPCGALGAGKPLRQRRPRGARAGRTWRGGLHGSERKLGENAQTQTEPLAYHPMQARPSIYETEAQRRFPDQIRVDPFWRATFLFGEGSGPLRRGGEKQWTPEFQK